MIYKKITVKEKQNTVSSPKDSFLGELLAIKNITDEEKIKNFLNPSREQFISPYAFCDMEKSVKRIKDAIENNQKILVWGDFDCDGVTSTTILYKTLKYLNADVITFIPDRLLHGHGLNSKELIPFISKQHIKLVITVDCGISNITEIGLLRSFGVDTIITDHHSTDSDIPNAYAVINPKVMNAIKEDTSVDDITSLNANSGSAIAYKLAMALLENEDNEKLKDELLIISACGIVADVVPLIGENRAMVSVALDLLNTKKEASFKPVYRLLSKNTNGEITSYDIAFVLAPRINAVGRLKNAELSFEFLTTEDDNKLNMIIEKLDNNNKIRQSLCTDTFEDIQKYLENNPSEKNNPAIILINKDWHIGVIGIVASKVVETYSKPCFLMTIDDNNFARCSIRSNESIDVYATLKENENLFSGFGGHKQAGGFSFDLSETSFEKVKEALLKTIESNTEDVEVQDYLIADFELTPEEVDISLIESINKLEPFGEANERPLFAMFDVTLEEFRVIGKENNHSSFAFSKDDKNFRAVNWGENTFKIPIKTKCDIAFYLRENTFNNVQTVQFELVGAYSNLIQKDSGLKLYDHRKKTGILDSVNQYLATKGTDTAVWAKNPNTKEVLSKFEGIKNNIITEDKKHKALMFFDYPATEDSLRDVLSSIKPEQIHFMNYKIDENIENYIRQLSGMLKYCANKLNGEIDIARVACALGVSEAFVQLALEILENIESIKILDIDKIKYLKSFDYEEFKNNSMFEVLYREFEKVVEFKSFLLNSKITELEELLTN